MKRANQTAIRVRNYQLDSDSLHSTSTAIISRALIRVTLLVLVFCLSMFLKALLQPVSSFTPPTTTPDSSFSSCLLTPLARFLNCCLSLPWVCGVVLFKRTSPPAHSVFILTQDTRAGSSIPTRSSSNNGFFLHVHEEGMFMAPSNPYSSIHRYCQCSGLTPDFYLIDHWQGQEVVLWCICQHHRRP